MGHVFEKVEVEKFYQSVYEGEQIDKSVSIIHPLTLYCSNSSGSDDNDGLTSDTPFKSLSMALDMIPQYRKIIINLDSGTYSLDRDLDLRRYDVTIKGINPMSTIISITDKNINISEHSILRLENVEVQYNVNSSIKNSSFISIDESELYVKSFEVLATYSDNEFDALVCIKSSKSTIHCGSGTVFNGCNVSLNNNSIIYITSTVSFSNDDIGGNLILNDMSICYLNNTNKIDIDSFIIPSNECIVYRNGFQVYPPKYFSDNENIYTNPISLDQSHFTSGWSGSLKYRVVDNRLILKGNIERKSDLVIEDEMDIVWENAGISNTLNESIITLLSCEDGSVYQIAVYINENNEIFKIKFNLPEFYSFNNTIVSKTVINNNTNIKVYIDYILG